MNILITGGLGLIGNKIYQQLKVDRSNKITIVDIKPSDNSNAVQSNIIDYKPSVKFDEIYHCASAVGPVGILRYKGILIFNLLKETESIINIAKQCGSKLIYFSTSEIYGHNGRLYEDSPKVVDKYSVRSEYAVGKMGSEISILNSYNNYIIIRPFNVVGPGQSYNHGFVLPRFIYQALNNLPLSVYGTGEQRRSFISVSDLATASILLMKSKISNDIFNIGNPSNTLTINQLASLVIKLCQSQSQITHVDPKYLHGDLFEEANEKIANIDKITSYLDWKPQISISDVIKNIIKNNLAC